MTLEDIVLAVLTGRGVIRVRRLSEKEIEEVARIEHEYTKSRSHWGKPVNVGALECLTRKFVFAALTRPDFKWPEGPYALLKVGDETVGVVDEKGVRIDRSVLARAKGEHVILFMPLKLLELDEIAETCIVASPSPPAHAFLLGLFGSSCGGCGTLLVGFDGLRIESKSLKRLSFGE